GAGPARRAGRPAGPDRRAVARAHPHRPPGARPRHRRPAGAAAEGAGRLHPSPLRAHDLCRHRRADGHLDQRGQAPHRRRRGAVERTGGPAVTAPAPAAADWLALKRSGRMTADEAAALEAWLAEPAHRAAFDAMQETWRTLGEVADDP